MEKNIKANQNIKHMLNGGICTFGKYNRKVFQGENGNFYIEKDENNPDAGVTIFTDLFCKLDILSSEKPVEKTYGLILVIKSNTLPDNAFTDEVDLKGQVLIANAVRDNNDAVEEGLMSLNIVDEFDDEKRDTVIDLAANLLSHKGNLSILDYN